MNKLLVIGTVLIVGLSVAEAKSLDKYIQEAQSYFDAKDIEQSVSTMETAIKEHPNNSVAYAKLGYYISETAKGYVDLFSVLPKAFAMWDTAIALDPDNVDARFDRGTWGTYVPQSMGQLSKAILDLEYVVEVLQESLDPDTQAQLVETYSFLADGYRKSWEFQKARATYGKVMELAPDTRTVRRAQNYIDITNHFEKWLQEREQQKVPDSPEILALKKKAQKYPDDADLLLMLGNTYLEANKDEEAAEIFERAVAADTLNLKAYKMLAFAIKRMFQAGYDPRISMDHNYRTDLRLRMMSVMEKAVAIAPEDLEMRLMRGTAGVESFFFMGRMDLSVEDLQMVIEGDAPDVMKAAARYQIGRAQQKKVHSQWLKVISEYPDEHAVDSVFNVLNPGLKQIDISQYETPVVVIDFVLGFKDELPPQTAVWVEDKEGEFIKTIYVSGFSGYARSGGRIPQWTSSSEFIDADAVTGASIDLGHHIYVWDLKDPSGDKVKPGEYVVKVETAFWPSMQYQCVEAPLILGKKAERVIREEGKLIPYVEVKYVP
jgi:tetratricopeptide (TPR) repeat protein